jgi:hypothetical protein
MRRLRTIAILGFAIVATAPVRGLPALAHALPPIRVERIDGQSKALPGGPLPLLIQYEDKDAQKQNLKLKVALGRVNGNPGNVERYEYVPVADVENWDWWPARKYVLDDLRAIAERKHMAVYADWKGTLRKAWGFARGHSAILLVGADGRPRFVGEGPLSDAQLAALMTALRDVGVDTGEEGR